MSGASVVKDTFSKMGNLNPITDELYEHLFQVKTVNLKILLDFSREWREHVKVSLLMATGLSLEEAIREFKRDEVRHRIRWDPLLNRKSLKAQEEIVERESMFSPEEMADRISEVRYDENGNDLLQNSYLDEYSETFSIQLPEEFIEDVKKGVFEPQKWRELAKELGTSCKETRFELGWSFDTKNRSVLRFALGVDRFRDGALSIRIQAEEENKVDDRMYDPVSETVTLRPVDGKPFNLYYISEWDDYDVEEEIEQEILDQSIPKARRWEYTYFARIFF